MDGLDVSRLAAVDIAVALRSYPRRFRDVLATASASRGIPADELVGRVGSDGHCGMDLLLDVVNTLTLLDRALDEVLLADDPALHPGVLDPSLRDWAPPPGLSLETLLDMLDDQCADLAGAVEGVSMADWSRPAHVADGPALTAITIAQEATRVGAEGLRSFEGTLRSAG